MKAILSAAAMGLALAACNADDKGVSKTEASEAAELRAANAECRQLVDQADIEAANPKCLSAIEAAREHGEQTPEYAQAVANAAWLFHMRGDGEEARQFYERAIALQEAHAEENPRALVRTLADYGILLTNGGDPDAGMQQLQRAAELLRAAGAEQSEAMASLVIS